MKDLQCFTTEINLGAFGEPSITIWYDYTPAQRGRLSGPPEDCYPDEPSEISITKILWEDSRFENFGWDDLDSKTQESLCESIDERETVNARAEREEAEYRRYESRMEARDYTDDWP